MATVGTLNINFETNVAQLINDMGKASRSVQQSSQAMTKSMKTIETVGRMAGNVFGGIVSVKVIDSALAYADAIDKAAERTGLAVREVQAYGYGAKIAGVAQDSFNGAMSKFNVTLGQAINGNKAASETLQVLGVDLAAVKNGSLTTGDAFLAAADGISQLGTKAERSAAMAQLFGKEVGPRMAAFLEEGRVGILNYAKQAENLGLVLDESVIKKAADAKDKFEVLGQIIKVNFTAGILEGFVDEFGKFSEDAQDPGLADGLRTLGGLVGNLAAVGLHAANGLGLTLNYIKEIGQANGLLLKPGEQNAMDWAMNGPEKYGPKAPTGESIITDMKKKYAEEQKLLEAHYISIANKDKATGTSTQITQTNTKVVDHNSAALERNKSKVDTLAGGIVQASSEADDFVKSVQKAGYDTGRVLGDLTKDVFQHADSWKSLRSFVLSTLQDIAGNLITMSFGGANSGGAAGGIANMIFSAFSGAPSHDYTGRYQGGKPYKVGVPELFVPGGQGGMAFPLDQLGGGGSPVINIYNSTSSRVTARPAMDGNRQSIEIMVDQAVARNINSPGTQTGKALRKFGNMPTTGR